MKKRINNRIKLIVVILLLTIALTVFILRNTFSKYQSKPSAIARLDAAFYIVDEDYQTMNLKLDSIVPRSEPYVYNFSISNTDGTNRAEVKLKYVLKIVATTNLHLNYKLYKNGNNTNDIITSRELTQDEYGTYFLTMEAPSETFDFTADYTNTYRLEIYFPTIYKDIVYQDTIEGIEIQVNSTQIITDDEDIKK